MLIIPTLGIETKIGEATYENFEDALKDGVWRAPDFSTPYERENPTILAAHRYGYLAWSNLFRSKSSFYNLPKLEEGEIVKVIWRQREYTFEVYATEEGEKITDYSADLILYTCETLNSPERIFKYARLIEI
jgi:sortase (surface protein transpeptidase)